jgi:hypothetical protein
MKQYDQTYSWMGDFAENPLVFCSSLKASRLGAPEIGEIFMVEGSKHLWKYIAPGKAEVASPTKEAVIRLLED